MPIDVQGNFLKTTENAAYVVEDIYVKGGYRVVTVDPATWVAANNDPADQAYQAALADEAASGTEGSLKIGCLVFDITSSRNFRCTKVAPDPVEFVEVFANDGSIDESRFVQRTELPQDANGSIDIASEATLQEALLSSIRVANDTSTNLSVATVAVPMNTTDALILEVSPAVPILNQAATILLTLNTNAIGGDAADA